MNYKSVLAAVLAAFCFHQAAMAEDAGTAESTIEIKEKKFIYSADGKRIGRIYNIYNDSDGTPQYAQVIYRHQMLNIPIETLSEGEKGYVTTLTWDEIK